MGTYLILRSRGRGKSDFLEERATQLYTELKIKEETVLQLNRELAGVMAEHKVLLEKLNEQKSEMNKIQEKFQLEFKNLANDIFDEKSRKFTQQNSEKLDAILKPFGNKIRDFEKKVDETYDKEAQQRFSLKEEVRRLAELNKKISEDAENLTRALRGDSKVQGNWGEMILENLLEKSGLVKDREYTVQASFQTEDGSQSRPDVIVNYPGERSVIIDAKVSLTAYDKYVAAVSMEDQEKYLKEHIKSVRNHVAELSKTDYPGLYQLKTLDFVMMFLPIEPAYLIAIQKDTDLWNYAYDRRILIISPTNLLAALKMIVSLWRQEYQNKNALEIARQAGDLLSKFYSLLEDLTDLGNRINLTRKSYDEVLNKLSEGKGNLIKRAKKIEELGARTKKSIPDNYNTENE